MSPRTKNLLILLATMVVTAALQAALNFLAGNPFNAGASGLAAAAGYGVGQLAKARLV